MGINFQEVWLASLMEFALWDEETIYLDSIKLVPDRMDPRNYFWKKTICPSLLSNSRAIEIFRMDSSDAERMFKYFGKIYRK